MNPTPKPVTREIAFWLGLKLVALAALYLLFFGPSHRPQADMATLFGVAPPAANGEGLQP